MSQKISDRTLMLLGDITGSEKIPVGVDGDLAITPDLLYSFIGNSFDADYWPLEGVAEITGNIAIDGNDFDMVIGDPNSLDEFQVNVNNALHLHAYDGVTHTHVSLHPDEYSVLSENSEVILMPELFTVTMNDGVDSSSFSLSPTLGYFAAADQIAMEVGGTSSISMLATYIDILAPLGVQIQNSITLEEIVPAQITSNQNNYSPTAGISYMLTSDASRDITGWVSVNSSLIFVHNSGSFDITFTHNDTANSTAANCFTIPGGGSLTLAPGGSAIWKYSPTLSRWRLYSFVG